jgi:hypothetical protein
MDNYRIIRIGDVREFQNYSSFYLVVADLLRGGFKQSQYGRIILPFTLPEGKTLVEAVNFFSGPE